MHISVYVFACMQVYEPFQPAAEDELERLQSINQSISWGFLMNHEGWRLTFLDAQNLFSPPTDSLSFGGARFHECFYMESVVFYTSFTLFGCLIEGGNVILPGHKSFPGSSHFPCKVIAAKEGWIPTYFTSRVTRSLQKLHKISKLRSSCLKREIYREGVTVISFSTYHIKYHNITLQPTFLTI